MEKSTTKYIMNIIFNPNEKEVEGEQYNIFKGFGYEYIETNITDKHKEIFQEFLGYILKSICENNKKSYHYLMSFIANILQNPSFKPHICPIFYSKEKGTGKSSFSNLIRKVLGNQFSYAGNIREIVEKHSTSSHFKFLNVIEELDKKMAMTTYENLKDKIQKEKTNINKKNKDIQEYNDYTRYIICLNDFNSLQLDRDNRRFVVYNFKKVNGKTEDLINEIYENNPQPYIKLFGEYLKNYNITFNQRGEWMKNRIQSKSYNLFLRKSSIEDWLVDLFKNNCYDFKYPHTISKTYKNIMRMKKTDLYLFYKYNQEDDKYAKKKTGFYKSMSSYDFIEEKTVKGLKYFDTNLEDLLDYLIKDKLCDNIDFKNYYETETNDE